MDGWQIQLVLAPTGGRGVRYRLLGPDERDDVALQAAVIAGPQASREKIALTLLRDKIRELI